MPLRYLKFIWIIVIALPLFGCNLMTVGLGFLGYSTVMTADSAEAPIMVDEVIIDPSSQAIASDIEAAAHEFFRLSASVNFLHLRDLICEEYQADFNASIERMGGENTLNAILQFQDSIVVDLSDITFTIVNQTPTRADVITSGQISINFAGQLINEPVDDANSMAHFILEDGEWRFCQPYDLFSN